MHSPVACPLLKPARCRAEQPWDSVAAAQMANGSALQALQRPTGPFGPAGHFAASPGYSMRAVQHQVRLRFGEELPYCGLLTGSVILGVSACIGLCCMGCSVVLCWGCRKNKCPNVILIKIRWACFRWAVSCSSCCGTAEAAAGTDMQPRPSATAVFSPVCCRRRFAGLHISTCSSFSCQAVQALPRLPHRATNHPVNRRLVVLQAHALPGQYQQQLHPDYQAASAQQPWVHNSWPPQQLPEQLSEQSHAALGTQHVHAAALSAVRHDLFPSRVAACSVFRLQEHCRLVWPSWACG